MISPYSFPGIRKSDLPQLEYRQITPDNIIDAVAFHLKIKKEFVTSHHRESEKAYARQLSMYLMRNYIPGLPLRKIGSLFSGRHHSTVIHSINRISELIAIRDEKVYGDLVRIKMFL